MADQIKTVVAKDQDGGVYDIPLDLVDQAVKQGLSVEGQTVEMHDSEGSVYDIPAQHYSQAQQQGLKIGTPSRPWYSVTPEGLGAALDYYSGGLEAGVNAARPAATMGLSPIVDRAMDAVSSDETVKARHEREQQLKQDYPGAGALGTSMGMMANPAIGAAGTLAGTAAKQAAPVAGRFIGGAVDAAAQGALTRAASTEGLDVEAAIDPKSIVLDAGIGAGVSAGVGAAEAVPRVWNAAKGKAADLTGTVLSKVNNVPKEHIAAYRENPTKIDNVDPTAVYQQVQGYADDLAKQVADADQLVKMSKEQFKEDKAILKQVWGETPVPEQAPQQVGEAFSNVETMIKLLDENSQGLINAVESPVSIQPVKAEIEKLSQASHLKGYNSMGAEGKAIEVPTELSGKLDAIHNQILHIDSMTPRQMVDMRRWVDDSIKFVDQMGVKDPALSSRLKVVRATINDTIESALPEGAKAAWRNNNQEISRLADVQGRASKSFGKEGSVNALQSTATDPDKRALLGELDAAGDTKIVESMQPYYENQGLAKKNSIERREEFAADPSSQTVDEFAQQRDNVKARIDPMTRNLTGQGTEQAVNTAADTWQQPHTNIALKKQFEDIAKEVGDPNLVQDIQDVGAYRSFNPDQVNKTAAAGTVEMLGNWPKTKAVLRTANRIFGIDTLAAAKRAFRARFNIAETVPDTVIEPVVRQLLQAGPVAAVAAHNALMNHNSTYQSAVKPSNTGPHKSKIQQALESRQLGPYQKHLEDAFNNGGDAGLKAADFVLRQNDPKYNKMMSEGSK
jgi:hypothetical protein